MSVPDYLLPVPEVGSFRHRLGLRPLDLKDWFVFDDDVPSIMASKADLMARRPDDVMQVNSDTLAGCHELLALVTANMATYHPGESAAATGSHPLARATSIVPDDLVLLDVVDPDVIIVAASVCAPNRWKLGVKFATGMEHVHRPVPGYQSEIGELVNRTLSRLNVERPVWRSNWGITDSSAWFQPAALAIPKPITNQGAAADRLHLRVERQTLRRLPDSGFVVFGIRTFQCPLSAFSEMPAQAEAFRLALAQLPDAMADYKKVLRARPLIDAWLSSCASR